MKTLSPLKTSLIALVASSALLTGSLYANDAQTDNAPQAEMHHKQGKHHKGGMHKLLRKLDLTDAQKADVKAVMEKYKAQRPERPTDEQRAAHKAEMLSLITNANFDEAKAQAMISAQQEKRQAQALQHLKMQNEIYQLLTPEQQEKYKARMEKGRHHKR